MAVIGSTIVEIFTGRVARTPDLVAMRYKQDGQWRPITFAEWDRQARDVAGGLLSLGVRKGDRVGLLSKNRPEWHIADIGVMLAGACTAPVYSTNSPAQVAYILGHSESKVAIVDDRSQLDKVLQTWADLPSLEKVVVITGEVGGDDGRVMTFEELRRLGRESVQASSAALQGSIASISESDVATVIYTSGTTGAPKGAVLSQANGARTLELVSKAVPLREGSERWMSYLPLSHVFERLVSEWGSIYFGGEVWFAESIERLRENLQECRPTFFVGVPRVYEKFYTGVNAIVAKESSLKRRLAETALKAGLQRVELVQSGSPVPVGLKAKLGLLDKVVLSKIRHGLGMEHVWLAVTGSAPLSADIIKFVHALGIELVEGYGLTETTAPAAVNPPGRVRFGTVGPALPGVEIKIDADGEILVRGPNVFQGYLGDEAATQEALTEDGFFRTGDIGELDEAGYLRITDRKKDIIITAGGKNVAPQDIEGRLTLDSLISQAVVIGDRRPFVSALLTLDPEVAPKWAKEQGIEADGVASLAEHPKVHAAVQAIVDRVNDSLSQVEKVKKWVLLPRDFTQEDEEITPTLKVRRKAINERYAEVIEGIYS